MCVTVGSCTPGLSRALHLPACCQCKLPAHHLHAGQILFKWLPLNRSISKQTPSTDLWLCVSLCKVSAEMEITSDCLYCHNRALNTFFNYSTSEFIPLGRPKSTSGNTEHKYLPCYSQQREIMLPCCDKILVICLAHYLKLSYNLTIISTMCMITGRAIDMHRQIIVQSGMLRFEYQRA